MTTTISMHDTATAEAKTHGSTNWIDVRGSNGHDEVSLFINNPEAAEQLAEAAQQIVDHYRDAAVREAHELEQAEREAEPEPDYEPDPADLDKIDHEQEKWERRHNGTVVHHGAPPVSV